jgi:REP element-mobilizing transposase RayT
MQTEIQRRKPNRLPEYDYSQAGVYYITICTHERQRILSDIVGDGFPVPKPIGRIAEEWIRQIPLRYPNICVDKQVIMPDHIHLLLRIRGTGNPSPTIEQ